MLEDSNRSSKDSQPEISVSNVSMRFLARSKYRNWRSFPKDCSREGEEREREREKEGEQMNNKKQKKKEPSFKYLRWCFSHLPLV